MILCIQEKYLFGNGHIVIRNKPGKIGNNTREIGITVVKSVSPYSKFGKSCLMLLLHYRLQLHCGVWPLWWSHGEAKSRCLYRSQPEFIWEALCMWLDFFCMAIKLPQRPLLAGEFFSKLRNNKIWRKLFLRNNWMNLYKLKWFSCFTNGEWNPPNDVRGQKVRIVRQISGFGCFKLAIWCILGHELSKNLAFPSFLSYETV